MIIVKRAKSSLVPGCIYPKNNHGLFKFGPVLDFILKLQLGNNEALPYIIKLSPVHILNFILLRNDL